MLVSFLINQVGVCFVCTLQRGVGSNECLVFSGGEHVLSFSGVTTADTHLLLPMVNVYACFF